MTEPPRARLWVGMTVLVLVVAAVIAVRAASPSDLWDQTQPVTVAYTLDIVQHGNWLLPTRLGASYATKPPLYNWLAAPFVAAFGSHVDAAHKAPSVLALLGCVGLLLWTGWRLRRPEIGVLAAIFFTANYTTFKLAYLARPDMVLTLQLLAAWLIGAWVLMRDKGKRISPWTVTPTAVAFWSLVAMAWMTKGPPALVVVLFLFVGARVITGRWSAANALGWAWGLPASTAIFLGWLGYVATVDLDHVTGNLFSAQVVGRMTGYGEEGGGGGVWRWIRTLPNLPLYFLVRFAPWSILAVIGGLEVRRRVRAGGAVDPILVRGTLAVVVYAVVVIAFYTLSAGKRADYIASIFGPAALLAAWQWGEWTRGRTRRRWGVVGAASLAGVALMAAVDLRPVSSIRPSFSTAVDGFVSAARAVIESEPRPVVFVRWGSSALPTQLGVSRPADVHAIPALAESGTAFWLVGSFEAGFSGRAADVVSVRCPGAVIECVVEPSPMFAEAAASGWDTGVPERLAVYLVRPPMSGGTSIFKAERTGAR